MVSITSFCYYLSSFAELQNQIELLELEKDSQINFPDSNEKIRDLEKTVRNLKREKDDAQKVGRLDC